MQHMDQEALAEMLNALQFVHWQKIYDLHTLRGGGNLFKIFYLYASIYGTSEYIRYIKYSTPSN